MEQHLPPWLCNDFLTHVLQSEEDKHHVVVSGFEAVPAAPPGVNYASCLTRVRVQFRYQEEADELHSVSLIIKSELTEGCICEIFEELCYIEPIFYNKFLPEASKITQTSFAPKEFFSPKFSAMVLEDLSEQGFQTADRTKQLDFDHCRLYAIAAANFHAVSVAVHKNNPELVEFIGKEKIFSNDLKSTGCFKYMIRCAFECLADRTAALSRFSRYCGLIRRTSVNLWDMLVEAHQRSEVLNTINQGDPWTTNMMFRYNDEGAVAEVKLVDFQALRYGSPVNDLIFFIWTSANHEVRRNRRDELYQVYLETLNRRLREFNCSEFFTFIEFMEHVKKLRPLVIFLMGVMLPLNFHSHPVNFGAFLHEEVGQSNPFEKYYNNSYCSNHLPKLLEQMEMAGVFNYLEQYRK
ncbi:hypothetical protein J6590_042556 [Homalodisca vitripennis]|nr:hypothetical protein J6590_042556 [Homalodisca vitripennis]